MTAWLLIAALLLGLVVTTGVRGECGCCSGCCCSCSQLLVTMTGLTLRDSGGGLLVDYSGGTGSTTMAKPDPESAPCSYVGEGDIAYTDGPGGSYYLTGLILSCLGGVWTYSDYDGSTDAIYSAMVSGECTPLELVFTVRHASGFGGSYYEYTITITCND